MKFRNPLAGDDDDQDGDDEVRFTNPLKDDDMFDAEKGGSINFDDESAAKSPSLPAG